MIALPSRRHILSFHCRVQFCSTMPGTFLFLFLFAFLAATAQTDVEQALEELNQRIDNAVVKKELPLLHTFYADDFVFTHGTGVVDSKTSWLDEVAKSTTRFISRLHDSTTVEVHDRLAIIAGRLLVTRQQDTGTAQYGIRYVRIYVKRKKQWQLISHRTVKEWHY